MRFLDLIAKYKIKILRLNEYTGWLDSDVSFLLEIPGIQGVDIISDKVVDTSPIFQLKKLKTLSLYCKAKVAGDFAELKELREIGLGWRNVYESIFGLDALERINILDFPVKDLTHWKRNSHLKYLRLESNKLENLIGIERFPNINRLDLFRCRKLASLNAIASSTFIRELKIGRCKGIQDLSPISHLTQLRELDIEDNYEIKSVAPIAKCKKLETLRIAGNTTVLDGNLGCLKQLPNLTRVLLAPRKHYSHTDDELTKK
jgi:Leucine-rich repeat (LRR) protein